MHDNNIMLERGGVRESESERDRERERDSLCIEVVAACLLYPVSDDRDVNCE